MTNNSRIPLKQVVTLTMAFLAVSCHAGQRLDESKVAKRADAQKVKLGRWAVTAPTKVSDLKQDAVAEILKDASIQFSTPDEYHHEPGFHFSFREKKIVKEIRLELLADKRFPDPRIGHARDSIVMLFDLKPTIVRAKEKPKVIDFRYCNNPADSEDDYAGDLVDYASDTGWTSPAIRSHSDAVELHFGFEKLLTFQPGDSLILHLDAGGGEFDAPARIRFAFSDRDAQRPRDQP